MTERVLVEKAVFCFIAKLKHVHDDDCFVVPFRVLAEDVYQAQNILEEWLRNPEQTGYKYACCVGITREASCRLIVAEEVKE